MTDLRIADAPELTAAEINDSLKVPTGGYGNYSITMTTIRDWLLNYKMFATQSYVDTKVGVVTTTLNNHTSRIDNPHQVTKSQVGLGNVDNTSDINKPVSSATQTALTNLNTSLTSAISVKANAADVYTKSEVYKKVESDNKYHQKLSIDGILAPTAVFDDVKNIDGVNGTPDSIINQPIQNLTNRTEFLKTHNNLTGRDSVNAHPSSSILDSSGQTQQQINELQKNTNLLRLPVFSVKAFGAKGDGITDDRAAIQAAIDACINNGGGTVFFPSTGDDYINGANDYSKFYAVKSTHPDYPDSALVVKLQGSQYVRGNLTFMGQGYNSRLELHTTNVIEKMMYFPVKSQYMTFDNFYLESRNKANYGLHMVDDYHPFLTMRDCTFRGSIEASTIIATYVSSFTRCVWSASKIGIKFIAPSTGPLTSLTLNSCYANNNTEVGYDFGYITYCSLNGCASDDCPIAYRFGAAYGVAMNGCGAERSPQPIKIDGYRGFSINTFFGLSCGSADSSKPSPYLIEFVSGANATVSGIQFSGARHYTYLLGATGSSYGSENITVLDRSVGRALAYYVSNYNLQRPIKFLRDDQTEVARTYNFTTVEELKSLFFTQYRDFNIDHTITVNLADGTYDLGGYLNLYRVGGRGELIIQGNASNRSLVKIDTGISNLRITDCSVRIVFKDLTLMSTSSNSAAVRLLAINSPNVVLDNCVLERGAVNTGYGVHAQLGSKVSIINNTTATGAFAVGSFIAADTSEILMPKMTTPPTSGTWTAGMRIYNSAPTTSIGWVYSAGAWKTFGAIV